LCEGSFDAMRFPSNGIAMLGKSLGNEYVLYKKIMERANADVVIVLDGDTAEIETKKLYKLLNVGRLFGKIKYIDLWNGISPYKDMSEIYEHDGKKGILNVLKQVKQYNEIDLIY
jgi:DNA primase